MLSIIALLALGQAQTELQFYVQEADPAYAVQTTSSSTAKIEAKLTSQKWKDSVWTHDLQIVNPKKPADSDAAILVITGDRVDKADGPYAQSLADRSGLRVVTVFNVPNQPLWNLREDELIAYTFAKYLENQSADWPLLFPMTKAASKAMDAAQTLTQSSKPINRFIVTGASKRGWTTWLAASLQDPRIVGMMPMVFDNLRFEEQLPHQKAVWGEYSAMIGDYTELGMVKAMETPEGQRLLRLVDPFYYLPRITIPTLVVNGTNDPYWTVDALRLYWADLKQPKTALLVPNKGHDIGSGDRELNTMAKWARRIADGKSWPEYKAMLESRRFVVVGYNHPPRRLWTAESDTLDFRKSVWKARGLDDAPLIHVPDSSKNIAMFAEMNVDGAIVTTPVFVALKNK